MTLRRRLLVVIVTFGGGICCFQPIMRSRMESRLSEIIRAKVEIGSSRISLIDGTIALRDVVIHSAADESQTTGRTSVSRIPQVAMRFDWNSLLYRNLRVNSLVATDIHWVIAEPTNECVPLATVDALVATDDSLSSDSDALRNSLATVIEPILQPLKLSIAQESAEQSRKQLSLATQIRDIFSQFAEATPSDGSFNVLRQTYIVKESKRQLDSLNQAIAEDRVARQKSEKSLAFLRESALRKLTQEIEQHSTVSSPNVSDNAKQLARSAIAKEWNLNRGILQFALSTVGVLRETPTVSMQMELPQSGQINPIQSEFASSLPVGITRLMAGKVKGTVEFESSPADVPEAKYGIELQFKNLSSRDLTESEKPAVNIRLSRDSQSDAPVWLTCSVQEAEFVQSDSTQFLVVIQRQRGASDKSVASIQHAHQGWSATIAIPMAYCIDSLATGLSLTTPRLDHETQIVGKLIGATSPITGDQEDILIEIEQSSIEAIEAVLRPSYDLKMQRRLAQSQIRGTEQLNMELQKVDTLWEQLGDEHARAHASWDASLTELNSQFEKIKSAFNRTSRANTGAGTLNQSKK